MVKIINSPNRYKTWTARKFAFVGIVVAVMLIFWAIAKLILVVALDLNSASPANIFTLPMLTILAALVLKEKGSMVLPIFIFSLLALPLPALGGSGFLLKVPILTIPFLVAEPIFWLLKKKPALASTASGALAGFIITSFLQNIFGGNSINPAAYLVGIAEAGIGGLVAYGIYTKIRDKSVIQWFLKPRDLTQARVERSRTSRTAFSLVVLAYLGFLGVINMSLFLPQWMRCLPYNIADKISAMGHLTDTSDIIHELVFSLIIATSALGLLVQLRNPLKNVASQLMALIVWICVILAALITNNFVPPPLIVIFGGLTLLATILHPAGNDLFSWFSASLANRVLLILVIIAAVPLLSLAVTNINLQRAGINTNIDLQRNDGSGTNIFGHKIPVTHDSGAATNQKSSQETLSDNSVSGDAKDKSVEHNHAAVGHYKNMAALSFIIISLGLLASLRPKGWRLTAWVTGFIPVLLGLSSLIVLDNSASLGLHWGLVAIIWGVVFIASAELTRDRELIET